MPTLRGAFLEFGAGLLGALPNIILFQFNPETVSRTPTLVQPPERAAGQGTIDAQQTLGDPSESISFSLRLDATDQLAEVNPIAVASGILPGLSALELLMYPQSAMTLNLFGAGGPQPHQHPPDKVPVVLFFWGPFRLYPVRITSLSFTEMEYDPLLNPIRAEVSVSLDVLTKSELDDGSFAEGAYTYTQGVKQVMAAINLANTAELAGKMVLSL